MYKAGIDGDNAPRAVFSSLVRRPRLLGTLAGMDQKNRCSGMNNAGIAGDSEPRAVLSFLVGRPMMLRIMAGMLGGIVARGIQENWISWEINLVPCIWQSCVWCLVFAFVVQDCGISWEFTSGMVSVCNTPWFDIGYMFGFSL